MDLLTGLVMSGIMAGGTYAASRYSADKAAKTGFAMNKESWKYYQKQKALDYCYDKNKYLPLDQYYNEWYKQLEYDWSQRYAENSAKWNVTGLKAAGLNPLLAASNGNFASTYGRSSPVTASRSGGGSALGRSADMHGERDVGTTLANVGGTVMRAALADSEMTKAESSAEVAENSVEAQINSARAQSVLDSEKINTERLTQQKLAQETAESSARTQHQALETEKLARSGGYSNDIVKDVNVLGSYLMETGKKYMEGVSGVLGNSAKSVGDFAKKVVEDAKPVEVPSDKESEKPKGFIEKASRNLGTHLQRNNGILHLR